MRYPNKLIKLDTKKVKSIYAVGDIHGEFVGFVDDLVNSCKVKNCCVIVCGDIGLGFYSKTATIDYFKSIEEILAPKNIYVIFFRGNHDNPEWFEYTEDKFANEYPHVIIAEDFTIVEHNNKTFPYKILLWGGGISVDRVYRASGVSYWSDEEVKRLPKEFTENKQINCVCSHAAPDFCLPVTTSNLASLFKIDIALQEDLENERNILSHGAYVLESANKSTLGLWIYGHYHDILYNSPSMNEELACFDPMRFIGLDMFRYAKSDMESQKDETYNIYNRKHRNHIIEIIKF